MPNIDHKPFVIIGNANISAEELMNLYGLTEDECHLKDERHMDYFTLGKVIKLWPRPDGDYQEHLDQLLKEDWSRTGGQIVKRARKKTRFKSDLPWYNELKRKGKG